MAVVITRQQADEIGRAIGPQAGTFALWEEIGLVAKKEWTNLVEQAVAYRFNLGAALINAVFEVQVQEGK